MKEIATSGLDFHVKYQVPIAGACEHEKSRIV